MLWIGLHLPWLSLESFTATLPGLAPDMPVALLESHRISAANGAARQLGIKAGLKRATALALAPALQIGQADAARDAEALQAVAHAALAFTPAVVVPPERPASAGAPPMRPEVLLEVQSSLRCFGGRDALLRRLADALAPLGHRVAVASAPTAMGAALLARDATPRRPCHCADLDTMRTALSRLPVWRLGPGREHWEALQGMGLRTLADLRRLPRAGLARRFGEDLLDEIDRAWGERPDPRAWLPPAPRFESRLELFARADTSEQVLHGAGVLLARLMAWAGAHQARVRGLRLEMRHEPRHRLRDDGADSPSCTPLEIVLAEPTGDATHVGAVLRERLGRLRLAAPTLELVLHATEVVHQPPPDGELFPTARSEHEGLLRLIERLQARLGPARVQRLVPTPDHRPERACHGEPASPGSLALPPRPVPADGTARPMHAPAPAAGTAAGARATGQARRPTARATPRPAAPATLAGPPSTPATLAGLPSTPATLAGPPSTPATLAGPSSTPATLAGPSSSPTTAAAAAAAATAPATTTAPAGAAARSRPPRPVPAAEATGLDRFTPDAATGARRPVWLLAEPLPLRERGHLPVLDGAPLMLCSGPERIEAGWWDDALAERDYFVARAPDGSLVWVFRGRLPGLEEGREGWFLQGRFG